MPQTIEPVMMDDERLYQEEMFVGLGFNLTEAKELSALRDDHGIYVYWGHVREMLDKGCTRALVLEILR